MKFYNKTSESPLSHKDNTPFDRFIRRMKIILFGGYYLICAALIFSGSLNIGSMVKNKIQCTEPVQGKISKIEISEYHSSDEDGGTKTYHSYYPVFSYNYKGCDYSYTAPQSNSSMKAGHKLDIYVNPDDPTCVYVPEYKTVWVNGIILIVVGIVMAVGMTVHIKKVRDGARNYYASLNNNE